MDFPIRKTSFKVLLISFAAFYITLSCNLIERKNERVVAKAFNELLLDSEVTPQIPFGTSSEDSTRMANKIIKDWVRTRAILRQAEKYLEIDQKEIEKKTKNYKNELIVYAYENQLIGEKMDTSISSKEIRDFYEENKPDFNSTDHLVKAKYVIVPTKQSQLVKKIEGLITLKDVKSTEELVNLCKENKLAYNSGNEWIEILSLNKKIPFSIEELSKFLDNNKTQRYQQSGNTFFLNILDNHLKTSDAVWEYEEKKIRAIIINKRKRELLQNIRKEIYNAARDRKEIEVFENK